MNLDGQCPEIKGKCQSAECTLGYCKLETNHDARGRGQVSIVHMNPVAVGPIVYRTPIEYMKVMMDLYNALKYAREVIGMSEHPLVTEQEIGELDETIAQAQEYMEKHINVDAVGGGVFPPNMQEFKIAKFKQYWALK